MASKYKVITYGNPSLRRKAAPIKVVDNAIRKLASDMLQTMYTAKGVGLAAQQIGRDEAICVIDIPALKNPEGNDSPTESIGVPMPIVMINPRIEAMIGEQKCEEGCLSFPDIFATIKRAAEVTVSFINLSSKEETIRAIGFLARAVQHELDHLNGILIVDRMSQIQKIGMAGKLKRLKKQAEE